VLSVLALLLLAPDAAVQESETKAQQALAEGRVAEALGHFEAAIRAADDTGSKLRLRDAYAGAGWAAPRRISVVEATRLGAFIRNERVRVYAKAATQCEGADQPHAAIILRRAVAELAGGKRAEEERKKIKKIVRDLTEGPSDEEKDLVAKLVKDKKSGAALLKAGRKLLRQRRILSYSFGGGSLLMTMIPIVNFLAMPVSVAGATAMWVGELKDNTQNQSQT